MAPPPLRAATPRTGRGLTVHQERMLRDMARSRIGILQEAQEVEDAPASIASEDTGEYVRSTRTFGIEYEINFLWANAPTLRALIGQSYKIVADGSVRNGLEVVSPILGGAAGEKEVLKVCKEIEKLGGKVDETCGLHIHLGAKDFLRKPKTEVWTLEHAIKFLSENPQSNHSFTILHNSVIKSIRAPFPEAFQHIVDKQSINFYDTEKLFSEALNSNKAFITHAEFPKLKLGRRMTFAVTHAGLKTLRHLKKPVYGREEVNAYVNEQEGSPAYLNATATIVVDPKVSGHLRVLVTKQDKSEQKNLERLKRLITFYTIYDDVIASMLPLDRRENDQTRRAGHRIALEDIISARTTVEILKNWHKFGRDAQITDGNRDGRPRGRYCGLNLYALIKQGTIEVRYLGGTIDPKRILHWLHLHQTIVDLAADVNDNKLSMKALQKAALIVDQKRRTNLFFKKLHLNATTEEYWRAEIERLKDDDEILLSECIEEDAAPPQPEPELTYSLPEELLTDLDI